MDTEDSVSLSPPPILKVLEALKQASHDLRTQPTPNPSAINALLDLQTFLSSDSSLSSHLSRLKSLTHSSSFLSRLSIAKLSHSIESQLQAWIDRETLQTLARSLQTEQNDDELIHLLTQFQARVNSGFNRDLQDQILKWKIFSALETLLRGPTRPTRVRERAALAIGALIRFNKDVFVGQVLMGPTVKALVGISTICSMKVLTDLIRSIKSPLVDELEPVGALSRVVAALGSAPMAGVALDCALEIGYFGRKEAVDALIGEGLVERLVELQRVGSGGSGRGEFAGAVARFAVSLEVGEGLRKREKRELKLEILKRVREVCVDSQAEAATILAEVLWGSSP